MTTASQHQTQTPRICSFNRNLCKLTPKTVRATKARMAAQARNFGGAALSRLKRRQR